MIILFLVGLFLGVLSVIFALQNIAVITVNFFSWQLTGSLALILMLAVGTGILAATLIILPESVKNHFRYKNLNREKEKLEEELRKQKELVVFAKQNPPTNEEISQIEKGAIDSTG